MELSHGILVLDEQSVYLKGIRQIPDLLLHYKIYKY